MEIDRRTVKALASPTRIEILRAALNGESTTTDISRELDKTKSTVSSHLDKLTEAELLEKDQKDGRRRVIYRPTRKAESIIEGREKKVQFSLISGTAFLLVGAAAFWNVVNSFGLKSASTAQSSEGMTAMSMDAARETTEASSGGVPELDTVFLAAGAFFISVSALSFVYGYVMNRLRTPQS